LQGTRYLPENDGEIGVWTDLWFNYPYIQKMRMPYGTSDKKPSYRMRKLLDRIWISMKQMSTGPFEDKQVEKELYFLNFPRTAFYYYITKGYYHDRLIGSTADLLQEKVYVNRNKQLYLWLSTLRDRWKKYKVYTDIKQNKPKIEVMRQQVAINLVGEIIRSSIYQGKYSCTNPYIPRYIEARREFTDSDNPNYVWGKLHQKQKQQAELIYGLGIDSISSSFLKYIIEKYCKLEVPGEEQYFGWDRDYRIAGLTDKIKRIFKKELEILEEMQDADK